MTSEEGFLQDIREHPDDDVPRLIYADWLEDNDRPGRAEFIRVECALAKMSEKTPEWRALWKRELELIVRHKDEWWTVFRKQCDSWDCRRGFAHEARISADKFLLYAQEMFLEPLHRLSLHDIRSEQIPRLVVGPYLGWVTDLCLRGTSGTALTGADIRALLARSDPGEIPETPVQNPIAEKSSRQTPVRTYRVELTTLDVGKQEIGVTGVEAILSTPEASRLRKLDLSGDWWRSENSQRQVSPNIGPEGMRLLVASPNTARLTALDLSGNRLGALEARALAESPYLSGLVSLDVSGTDFDEESSQLLRERFGERVRL